MSSSLRGIHECGCLGVLAEVKGIKLLLFSCVLILGLNLFGLC